LAFENKKTCYLRDFTDFRSSQTFWLKMTNCQTEHFKKKQSSQDVYFTGFKSLAKLKVRKSIFEDGKKMPFRTFEG
jgi:hypothetical protein